MRLPWLVLALLAIGGISAHSQSPQKLIDSVLKELEEKYIFPEVAVEMTRGIRQRETEGRYRDITDGRELAKTLTADLQAISKDKHLRVVQRSSGTTQGAGSRPRAALEKHERLPGNVGYIKFAFFPGAEVLGAAVTEAMKELATTDALIIDLRGNGGGSPDGIMYVAGHFFEKPTLVARILSRVAGQSEMSTLAVPGPLYVGKDVYILIDQKTFSAAEALAYHLKHLKKFTVVGEASGGGAHRVTSVRIDDFYLFLPVTRPVNVVTGGDWEGTGVIPDIRTASEAALTAAHLTALRKLPATPERLADIRQLQAAKPAN